MVVASSVRHAGVGVKVDLRTERCQLLYERRHLLDVSQTVDADGVEASG